MKFKTLWYLLPLCLMIWLTGCTSNDSATDLLRSVPRDTKFVALLNLEHTQSKVTPEAQEAYLEAVPMMSPESKDLVEIMKKLGPASGIKYTYGVVFEYKGLPVASCLVENHKVFEEKLLEFAKAKQLKVENSGGVIIVNDRVLLEDHQVWMMPDVTRDKVEVLRNLTEKESFMSVDYSSTMLANDRDGSWFADLKGLSSIGGSTDAAQMLIGVSAVFENPAYLGGTLEIDGKQVGLTCQVLDSSFKPSKTWLSLNIIDVESLKKLTGKGDFFVVVNPTQNLVSDILDRFGALAGLPENVEKLLKAIRGQIVVYGGNDSSLASGSVSAVAGFDTTADAEQAASLLNQLGLSLEAVVTGDRVVVAGSEQMNGTISFQEIADAFKDAGAGFYVTTSFSGNTSSLASSLSGVAMMLLPSNDTLTLRMSVYLKK